MMQKKGIRYKKYLRPSKILVEAIIAKINGNNIINNK